MNEGNFMFRDVEKAKALEVEKRLSELAGLIEVIDVPSSTERQLSKRKKSPLSINQLRALTVASHFRLLRSRSGWWANTDFKFGDRRNRKRHVKAITVRKLWERGYLSGMPDGILMGQTKAYNQPAYLEASEAGKALLEQIRTETGLYFDLDTFEVVRPKRGGLHPTRDES
jgi:hypothetical protein